MILSGCSGVFNNLVKYIDFDCLEFIIENFFLSIKYFSFDEKLEDALKVMQEKRKKLI